MPYNKHSIATGLENKNWKVWPIVNVKIDIPRSLWTETKHIIKTYSPPTFCYFCLDTKVTQKSSPKKGDCSAPLQSWDALHPHLFHDFSLSLVFGRSMMVEVFDFDQFIIHNLLQMSGKVNNFMSMHYRKIIIAKTLVKNLPVCMELQISINLHRSHKLRLSGLF